MDKQQQQQQQQDEGGEGEGEDVDKYSHQDLKDAIIKLVRLIANLSINQDIGMKMGSNRDNLEVSLR
jgi:hypothetical protein